MGCVVPTAGNDLGLFALDTATGEITLDTGKALDFESNTSHTLTISATAADGGSGDTATVTVNVTGVNDNNPDVADVTVSYAENIAPGTSITDLSDASGGDTDGDGSALTYAFTAGNDLGLFALDTATGEITLDTGKALDFESNTSHTLTISATAADGGSGDTATVTVNVTGVNDNNPDVADVTVSYAENIAPGTSITDLSDASGGDTDGDGSALTYAFTAGNDLGLFALDTVTGEITLDTGKALDFETNTSHTLTISATAADGGSADTATVTVNVTGVNDNDPALTPKSIEVLDSVSALTELIDLSDSNTSNDTDLDGDAIEYSITAGNENKLFAIEEATGKLSLANESLDYDKSDQHVLTIKATDSGGRSGTATITIDVKDSNTAPDAVDDAITLNEDSSVDVAAASGIIQSNDSDAEGDFLTVHKFYLGDSTEANPIQGILGQAINGTYGLLTLNADGSYQYSADNANALGSAETVIDSFHYVLTDNKLTQTADIQFTITGINDAPSLVDATKKKKYIEGQSNVTVIDGSLNVVDPDDTVIERATVRFSSDTYQASEDVLGFTDAFNIAGDWDNSTGQLSLTGSTTISNYIAALETVTYTNTDNKNPVLGHRKIEWTVNDGDANSTAITSIVDVGGTNDAPESVDEAVDVEAGSTVSTESQAKLLANDTDPEGDSLTIQQFRLGTEQQSSTEFQAGNPHRPIRKDDHRIRWFLHLHCRSDCIQTSTDR
jgi:VCBS repeat-containing protein